MLTLKRLHLQNFLSHGDSEIHFTDYDGLTLIAGRTADGRYDSNGSGKSTILEGVYYALTGKTLRGLTGDSVVNRIVGRDCCVSLDFTIGDTSYEIRRYRSHHSEGNNLKWVINGEDHTQRLPTDTQEQITSVIDTPPEILVGVMLMGEGLSSKFTSLSDPDKKRMLEQTVRLSHNIRESDDNVVKESKLLLKKLGELSGTISSCESTLQRNKEMSSEDKDELIREESKLESDVSSLSTTIQEFSKLLSDYNNKLTVLTTAESSYDRTLGDLNRVSQERSALESTITELRSVEHPVCPTCGQTVDNTSTLISNLSGELERLTVSVEFLQDTLSTLPDINIIRSKKDQVSSEMRELSTKQRDSMTEQSQIQSRLRDLTSRIKVLSTIDSQNQELTSTIESAKRELSVCEDRAKALDYIHKKLYSSTGILSDILRSVVEFIDSRLSVYTQILMDKPMKLEMSDKGKITLSPRDSTYSYNSFSNGEKRRLDISIQFALHDYCYMHCGVGFDTLFIDEVLDTLDDVGVTNILQVLKMKMEYCGLSRIFVVTHNDELKSYFDSALTVSKDLRGMTSLVS